MALYPSLEDMKISQYHDAEVESFRHHQQHQQQQQPQAQPSHSTPALVTLAQPAAHTQTQNTPILAVAYPQLNNEYLGLQLEPPSYDSLTPQSQSQQALQPQNTAEWQVVDASPQGARQWVAPLSGQSQGLARAAITNAVREVWLHKNAKGKVGLRLRQVNNGIFVQFVLKDSPASAAKLRLGDQILQVDGEDVLGMSGSKVEKTINKIKKPQFTVIVRDRPFERTITMHKDSTAHLGFTHRDGVIRNIVKNSSAARNGLLTDHRIVEVNGQNVVGFDDKTLAKTITDAGHTVTLTILPVVIYEQIMKKIGKSQIKKDMDHSILDLI